MTHDHDAEEKDIALRVSSAWHAACPEPRKVLEEFLAGQRGCNGRGDGAWLHSRGVSGADGIEAPKKRGVYKGRPPTLDHDRIVVLRQQGKGAMEIARELRCSRGGVDKVLNMIV